MLQTTVGQLLVNQALPPELRDYKRTLDGKAVRALFQQIAEKYPENYKDLAKKMSDVGRELAYSTGGFTFGAAHLAPAKVHQQVRAQIAAAVDAINESDASDDDKSKQIILELGKHQKSLEDAIYQEARESHNPLADQILSGSRGKPGNLKSLIGSDIMYRDHRDRMIPVPILHGYAQGLTPAEYFAGAFGARQGVIAVKMSTGEAGFFGKQLTQAAHRLLVTREDDDADEKHRRRGLPVDTDDPDNEGALLSFPAGGYPRNTALTPKILSDLKDQGVKRLVVRSPIVGGPEEGGLYGRDVGFRERGRIAPVGDQVGNAAAAAISEPVSQGGLSEKHSGGVAGAGRVAGGFKMLDMLVQVPKTFTGGAAHSDETGTVQTIVDAPAGGKYIRVNGKDHYVPPGATISVKPGQEVEAGDVLSDGLPNPSKVVQHKGIGEGRRYFTKTFLDALKANNISAHRRNVEILSRGLIDHVRMTDELGDRSPDDVVSYDRLEKEWQPRAGFSSARPSSSLGKYLETPVLHYTIGTKISKSMLPHFQEAGIDSIDVHSDPPPFQPEMIRGMDILQHDPDWMTRQLGSNLKKSFLNAVHTAASSDPLGTSYVPALANPTDFGRKGLVKGFEPEKAPKPGQSALTGLGD